MIKIDNFSLSFNFFSNSLSASICENALGGVTFPCKKRMAIKTGINADTILGRIKWGIVDEVEIFPLTQSMIVVTSPIDGVVKEVYVNETDKVSVGDKMLVVEIITL